MGRVSLQGELWRGDSWALAVDCTVPPQILLRCHGKPWLLGLLPPPSFSTPPAISPSSQPSTGMQPSWAFSRGTPPTCCPPSSLVPTPSPLRSSWQVSCVPTGGGGGSCVNGSCNRQRAEGGSQRRASWQRVWSLWGTKGPASLANQSCPLALLQEKAWGGGSLHLVSPSSLGPQLRSGGNGACPSYVCQPPHPSLFYAPV